MKNLLAGKFFSMPQLPGFAGIEVLLECWMSVKLTMYLLGGLHETRAAN